MKKGILAVCFAMSAAGLAVAAPRGVNNAAIYGALNVTAAESSSGNTLISRKSVGGLECTREVQKPPGQHALITTSCKLDFAQADAAAIYNALNVPEEGVPNAPRLMEQHTRTVDALTCTKSQYLVAPNAPPKPTYSCELKVK